MIGWATASLTPRRHTCYLVGIPQTAGNAITLFIRTPSVKELLNDCGMGWFQVDFSRKDICHDDEIDILRSLAKLQLRYV